jgi:nitrate reductase gamma subunit
VNQVEGWIEFGRGPLFRLAFAVMVLGLLRILLLSLVGLLEAYRRSFDKIVPWKELVRQTAGWLVPMGRLWRKRPIYSMTSFLFHVGLIATPLFLAAHVLLWRQAAGFAWPALPQRLAGWLTLAVIVTGLGLFAGRLADRGARALSRLQDYAWPLLLVAPFISGYVCTNMKIGPDAYQTMMFLHLFSANLIMLMIPFTKIAHCVLAPLSQLVTALSWKFPLGAGDRAAATLGCSERPSWVEKARLTDFSPSPPRAREQAVQAMKEICIR